MPNVSKDGLALIAKKKEAREQSIKELTASQFDITNVEQMKQLKTLIDEFEYAVNQMYLCQALSTGVNAWLGSFVVGRLLPIPEFINYTLATFLWIGTAAYILERFSWTDFSNQVNEMKNIYSWIKSSQAHNIDDTLGHPDIERLVKTLAPFCETDFIVNWAKLTHNEDNDSGTIGKALNIGIQAVSATLLLFSTKKTKEPEKEERVRLLKIGVERRMFDVGVYAGLEHSLKYLTKSPDFRELLKANIKMPEALAQVINPQEIMGYFIPSPGK